MGDYAKVLANSERTKGVYSPESAAYYAKIEADGDLVVMAKRPFPSQLKATKSHYAQKIVLKWDKVASVSKEETLSYSLYRQLGNVDRGQWERIASDLTETTYEDTVSAGGLVENQLYLYAVRAVFSYTKKVESTNKETGETVTDEIQVKEGSRLSFFKEGLLLSNLKQLEASFRDHLDRIEIYWLESDGANFYKIYRKDPSASESDPFTFVTSVKECRYVEYRDDIVDTDADLVAGKEYKYKVIPHYDEENGAVDGASTIVVFGAMLALGAPDTPNLLSVSRGEYGDQIYLTWAPMDGVTFKIYRSNTIFGPFVQIDSNVSGSTYGDKLNSVPANQKDQVFYYRISSQNSFADSKLSAFDEMRHSGSMFFFPEGKVKASKRIFPQQIDLAFSLPDTMGGDKIYIQYSTDQTVWTPLNASGDSMPLSKLSASSIADYDPSKSYYFQIRAVKSALIDSNVFGEETNLKGKSNLISIEALKAGPEIPVLVASKNDHSIKGKIRVEGSWSEYPNYGDYVEVSLLRYYSFGRDTVPVSKPINVVEKVVADFGAISIDSGTFTFLDDIVPDINVQADTVSPMNAVIPAGSGWTYWTWDREAWKYIKRKMPFDMKKAVGSEYKVKVRWKGQDESWETSISDLPAYGYQAITDDEFSWLGLWMREVAMNRLWHLLYPPYHGTIQTTISMLTAPQNKRGEYAGEVGFTAEAEGFGGRGSGWLRNYSDWGPDWNINIEKENSSFDIVLKYKDVATFDMPISVRTPLYKGDFHAVFKLENGLYQDKPKAGSTLKVTQEGQPSQLYENLDQEGSIIMQYFPAQSYEQRKGEGGTHSYELTTINFKYPLDDWVANAGVDWTMYYGFTF